jgi:hypothetical protein
MKPFEQRKEEFLKKYGELVDELKCDVGSAPAFFPIGGGAFAIMLQKEVMDLENAPVPSPFQG